MRTRRQKQNLRVLPSGPENDTEILRLNGEIPTPTAGISTPRRIVKSLKAPPTCVTQLVQLDTNQPPQTRRFSSIATSLPSDCSVSEVRSELCSCAVDEQGDISMSSFFTHVRQQGGRNASMSRADARKVKASTKRGVPTGNGHGVHGRQHRLNSGAIRAVASRGSVGRDAEESTILSYSESGSFYSCDSTDNSTASKSMRSASSGSCGSVSYTVISESVPSCSLTIMGDQVTRVPVVSGWGTRGRRNPPIARKHSESFGSLFGGGINLNDGTSISSAPRTGKGNFASSQATSLCTPRGSTAQPPSNGLSAKGAPRNGSAPGFRADSEAGMGSTVSAHPAPSSAKEDPGATPPFDESSSSAPNPLDVTQQQPEEAETAAQLQKRKMVTISGVSPKRKERRSSLFNLASPVATTTNGNDSAGAPTGNASVGNREAQSSLNASAKEEGNGGGDDDGGGGGGGGGNDSATPPPPRVTNARRESRIGRGSYGDVYRGVDLDTGRSIAIKEILVPKDFTKDLEKQLLTLEREIRVMRKLLHPNIINYLGAVRDQNSLSIFMEFISGGTVGELLREEGALKEERTRGYTAQLLCGLEYLHNRQVVHRDLKGDNLFLGENDVLKLGDFGTSKELVTTLVTDSVAGTPNFMAPEVIACSGHSYAADIWSVGCCVLEMLTGLPPFAKLDNHMAVMFAVMKGKLEEQVPEEISGGAKDFIRVCTRHDPKDRWTVSQLRRHPWLVGNPQETTTAADTAAATTTTTTEAESDGAAAAHAAKPGATTPPSPPEDKKKASHSDRSPRSKASKERDKAASPTSRKRSSIPAAPPQQQHQQLPPVVDAIASSGVGRKARSAAPLEPSALAKTGTNNGGGGGGTTHLPAPKRSPLPPSEDGEVGGTTSSDPSSNGNSPGSRLKLGKRGNRKGGLGTDGCNTAVSAAVDSREPTTVVPPLKMAVTAGGDVGIGNGRSLANKKESVSGAGLRSNALSSSSREANPSAEPLAPHRPSPRSGSAKGGNGGKHLTATPSVVAPSRRRSQEDGKSPSATNGLSTSPPHGVDGSGGSSGGGGEGGGGVFGELPSPPAGSPTNNPRRSNASANGTAKQSASSPRKEKRKKSKVSA